VKTVWLQVAGSVFGWGSTYTNTEGERREPLLGSREAERV
jgi:hypothetical protein